LEDKFLDAGPPFRQLLPWLVKSKNPFSIYLPDHILNGWFTDAVLFPVEL